MTTHLAPVLYLPHGGGPMPLMNDPAHAGLISFLQNLPASFPKPSAIVLISAHWEEAVPSVNTGANPGMLFDYHGFPPETYRISYPAPGNVELSERIIALIKAQQSPCEADAERGFDHGVFVPLMLLYPEADIPVVQLSLITGLDATQHMALGQSLQELRKQNILIIGSGMSFHNLRAVFAGVRPEYRKASDEFADWLVHTMTDTQLDARARSKALQHWQDAPYATFCHPRAEHFLPLHVCAGAAGSEAATLLFDEDLMGHRVNGFGWF